ncbi:hypothetical protein R3P38DRAFT_2863924 [Favolaschia claudopus]|uniref:Uncharacterized protein n=1 Tax=Favolaschia claudopus TaxID=2862362 RepID=A0AAW0DGC5_9AGAR
MFPSRFSALFVFALAAVVASVPVVKVVNIPQIGSEAVGKPVDHLDIGNANVVDSETSESVDSENIHWIPRSGDKVDATDTITPGTSVDEFQCSICWVN